MQAPSPDHIRDAMALAILRSERVRALASAALLGGLGLVIGVIFLVSDAEFAAVSAYAQRRFAGVFVLLGGIAAELGYRWALGRFIATGTRPPRWAPVAHTTGELCIPTVALIVFMTFAHPAEVLGAPPTYGYLIIISLTILQLDPRISIWAGCLAAAQYALLVWWHQDAIADYGGTLFGVLPAYYIRAIFFAAGGVVAAVVAAQLRRQVLESITRLQERDRVVDLFGQHVSPAVARSLLAGEPDQAQRDVVVLFLDIRGFTGFSSGREPAEVMGYLDALLGPLMETVRGHRGIVDKLLGDGFMAVFGAPEPDPDAALHAVRAARAMLDEVDRLVAEGLPETRVAIGIHRGPVMAGLIGSGRRREYTIIGDTVNVASRVEGVCRDHDAALLITDAVWQALPADARIGEALPPVALRGRAEPMPLYRLVPARPGGAQPG